MIDDYPALEDVPIQRPSSSTKPEINESVTLNKITNNSDANSEENIMDQMMMAAVEAKKQKNILKEAEIDLNFGNGLKGLSGVFSKTEPEIKKEKEVIRKCHGPGCGKDHEKSEFSKCARCKCVWYCSKACQTAHWKGGHSKECKKIEKEREIPFVKKQDTSLQFPEVQKAMSSQMDMLMKNKESWMTPDLTEKISSNSVIRKALSDPQCAAALNEFQSNPGAAAKKYKDVPQVNEFFKQYFGIMGEHLTSLGEAGKKMENKENPPPPPPPLIQTVQEAEEQRKINEILSNPVLKEILEDPKMMEIMKECQQPGRLKYFLNNKIYGPKLRILSEAGLVQIHM